jgi:hypothetical protein
MPPAPAMFSMITCCPDFGQAGAEDLKVSDAAPTANGTTMVSGRDGQVCAAATCAGTRTRSRKLRKHAETASQHDGRSLVWSRIRLAQR